MNTTPSTLKMLWRRWVHPVILPRHLIAWPGLALRYWRDWRAYAKLPGAETLDWRNSYPCLFDRTDQTPFDPHLFFQAAWISQRLGAHRPVEHVDVGSDIRLAAALTGHAPVVFIDLRPLQAELPRLKSRKGTVLDLPYEKQSVPSLSCMHVAEHIGLGRYGDPLNPSGSRDACRELQRVLAAGGQLWFTTPVGKPAVFFNAHRVHRASEILSFFPELSLREFSFVGNDGQYRENASITAPDDETYALGMFWLERKTKR